MGTLTKSHQTLSCTSPSFKPERIEDHGEEDELAKEGNNKRGWGDDLGEEEEEHREGKQDGDGQRDLAIIMKVMTMIMIVVTMVQVVRESWWEMESDILHKMNSKIRRRMMENKWNDQEMMERSKKEQITFSPLSEGR